MPEIKVALGAELSRDLRRLLDSCLTPPSPHPFSRGRSRTGYSTPCRYSALYRPYDADRSCSGSKLLSTLDWRTKSSETARLKRPSQKHAVLLNKLKTRRTRKTKARCRGDFDPQAKAFTGPPYYCGDPPLYYAIAAISIPGRAQRQRQEGSRDNASSPFSQSKG